MITKVSELGFLPCILLNPCVSYQIMNSLAVDSDSANTMMDLIRDKYVNGDLSAIESDDSGIKLVEAEEFG
jgi:hypothetical protein